MWKPKHLIGDGQVSYSPDFTAIEPAPLNPTMWTASIVVERALILDA
jgi:hypothetical protein